MNDLWKLIHAERAALADDLVGLTDDQWESQSLCSDFTVRETLAHLTAGASLNPVRWMAGVIRCRFDFDKQVAYRLADHLGTSPTETLERFRRIIPSTTKAPIPVIAMLGETIVHGEDIRRPLAIHRDYPIATITRLAQYYAGSDLVVLAKSRIRDLRLVATDGPFTTGTGDLITGPTIALTLAMTGRTTYWTDLKGPGINLLRTRSAGAAS
ncbi:maleylpyruvate isomerase family mycothiol-dependent enzyme [Kribbella sp. NPDC023855]|uniref:maleylpyruvate isomerase family mycothiol-dependent enzyme n=1 Tax=Kribbella sp. NPDC023855 TaxID=3154698 RepID=UPI0033E541A4